MNPLLKFSDMIGETNPYSDHYFIEKMSGGTERLTIAPSQKQIDLICSLLSEMEGPYGFLYIMVVSRSEYEPARYQLEQSLDLRQVSELLRDFQDFFEQDGRCTLFLGSHCDGAQIIYDRHNIIYAYGNLDAYRRVLRERGFLDEKVIVPAPHKHYYHKEFDEDEKRLFAMGNWFKSPLHDTDV